MEITKPFQSTELYLDLQNNREIDFEFDFWHNIIKLIELIFKEEIEQVKPFTKLTF